jgi:NAD dependent epimerase/dehydratase family enzyme
VTNKEFSRALGRALHRPAVAPIPGFAIRLLYGDMAEIVTEGQRAVPRRTLELGYTFKYTDLDAALKSATSA